MIVLDTCALIDSLAGQKRSAPVLRQLIERGERILLPSIVLYEWLRGQRTRAELEVQESLFPNHTAINFGVQEALVAAELYKRVSRPRGRELALPSRF